MRKLAGRLDDARSVGIHVAHARLEALDIEVTFIMRPQNGIREVYWSYQNLIIRRDEVERDVYSHPEGTNEDWGGRIRSL